VLVGHNNCKKQERGSMPPTMLQQPVDSVHKHAEDPTIKLHLPITVVIS
jgi:hypothetical protein